jgi:D-glycero-alpha-D-manno-heptose-7-phosphate kinase
MILVRSPLRISIAGGSTDLKSFYSLYDGMCISVAIDKYVYVSVHRTFQEEIILKYSELEKVKNISEVKHPIIREALKLLEFKTPQIEITSHADVPASSGLGSSSSFTCSLLKALFSHRNIQISPQRLAELACFIEIDKLQGNLGKQDQTISAYGGIQVMEFHKDETVSVNPLKISIDNLYELQDSMLLFFTGFTRNANDILKDQVDKTKDNNEEMIKNILKIKEMGYQSKNLLENGNIAEYGKLMHEHWLTKRKRSPSMSNPEIDSLYQLGIDAGAYGGKLIGAGGGGFLLFITDNPKGLRKIMKYNNIEELRFQFDFEGTKRLL